MQSISPNDVQQALHAANNKVLAVVVVYNRPFASVPCARRLIQWLTLGQTVSSRLQLAHCLVYDNSPTPQPVDGLSTDHRLHAFHDAGNGGTRAAYLHALRLAQAEDCAWILFLDHDTDLPEGFLDDAAEALNAVPPGTSVGAVVAQVCDESVQISPARITSYGRVLPGQQAGAKPGTGTLTAIASASLFSTQSLAAVLPIPADFSLDYLDHWLFREVQRRGMSVAVSAARVRHSLSVQSMKSMGVQRYRAILAAELAFLQGEPDYSRLKHFFWHLGRTAKLAWSTHRLALLLACSRGALNIACAP